MRARYHVEVRGKGLIQVGVIAEVVRVEASRREICRTDETLEPCVLFLLPGGFLLSVPAATSPATTTTGTTFSLAAFRPASRRLLSLPTTSWRLGTRFTPLLSALLLYWIFFLALLSSLSCQNRNQSSHQIIQIKQTGNESFGFFIPANDHQEQDCREQNQDCAKVHFLLLRPIMVNS